MWSEESKQRLLAHHPFVGQVRGAEHVLVRRLADRLAGVQVQQQVRSLVGTRFAEFETKYKDLSERMNKNQGTVLDAPAVIGAYKDLAQTFVAAKRAQVDALNDAGMSLDEYRWIRTRAYAALGIPLGEVDVSQVIDDIREGRQPRQPEGVVVAPTGPEGNRALVEPHRKTLEENAARSRDVQDSEREKLKKREEKEKRERDTR